MADQLTVNDSVDQAPGINVGNFFWKATDKKIERLTPATGPNINKPGSNQQPLAPAQQPVFSAPPPLPASANVLTFLQNKTFAGKGFNTIFRPRSSKPIPPAVAGGNDNVLQLNLTKETLKFSASIGNVPNRGFDNQEDITLNGVSYVQTVQDVTNPATGLDDAPGTDIHFEPGLWMAVPATSIAPVQGPTLCRMASIPHGTTINAQGPQPDVTKPVPGKPQIPAVDITPFGIGQPDRKFPFPSQTVNNSVQDRTPGDLTLFNTKGTITDAILKDPNTVLRNAIKNQDIVSSIRFDITTASSPLLGGGISNIGFLGGTSSSPLAGGTNENAFATTVTATFWVETVRAKIVIKPAQHAPQLFPMAGPGGGPGPTFVVPPTLVMGKPSKITQPLTMDVTWTQLQYSQTVLLNFAPLSWPHVSVATLSETGKIPVILPS